MKHSELQTLTVPLLRPGSRLVTASKCVVVTGATLLTLFIALIMCAVKCHYLFCCVAGYFTDCIYEQDLDEMNIEIIRNLLYKVSSLSFPIHK